MRSQELNLDGSAEKQSSRFFYLLLLIASVIWCLYRRQQNSRLFRLGNMLPGPVPLPFIGNAHIAIGRKPNEFIKLAMHYASVYGYVGRGWIGSKLIIMLGDPQDVEVILNSNVHINKAKEYSLFKPWLGDGLLISSGEKWKTHRKMIAPTFHINILKSFVEVFNRNSRNVVEQMRSEKGKVFDVHHYMSGITVDILLETAMGVSKKQTQEKSGFDYAMAVLRLCDIIHQRHYKVWLRPDIIFRLTSLHKLQSKLLNIIHGLSTKVIKIKKAAYSTDKLKETPEPLEKLTHPQENVGNIKSLSDTMFQGLRDDLDYIDENDIGEKKRLAFLDLMIESAINGTNNITDLEIKEEVNTIMFEGHDTTAAGSAFVLCLLGVHQNIQNKVYAELYEIFGDSDRPATFLDTLHMKYLERVILETFRLYPPVPIIARELKQDVRIVTNNYLLPAGATVVIGTYGIHRHPNYYKNPNDFNPDNFLPENTQNRHYYSYIPFSAGPRSCVGRKYAMLKLKVLLSTILRNFKTTSAVPEEEFELTADIILKRSDGFRIKLEERNKTRV